MDSSKDTSPSIEPVTAPPTAADSTSKTDKPVLSVAEIAAAHARAHKRLTIIETIGVVLLIFAILAGLAGWAFYQQETEATAHQPYSANEYQ